MLCLGKEDLQCIDQAIVDYQTEAEVGIAIQESGIPREEIFITTKALKPHDVEGSLRTSLSKLQTSYVDLYVLQPRNLSRRIIDLHESGTSYMSHSHQLAMKQHCKPPGRAQRTASPKALRSP